MDDWTTCCLVQCPVLHEGTVSVQPPRNELQVAVGAATHPAHQGRWSFAQYRCETIYSCVCKHA